MNKKTFDEYVTECIHKLKTNNCHKNFVDNGQIFACSNTNKAIIDSEKLCYLQFFCQLDIFSDIQFYKIDDDILREKYNSGYCIKPCIKTVMPINQMYGSINGSPPIYLRELIKSSDVSCNHVTTQFIKSTQNVMYEDSDSIFFKIPS